MVHIWNVSPESSHGFIVFPGFCYLIWRKRAELAATAVSPAPAAGILVAGSFLIFVLGKQSGLPSLYRPAVVLLVWSYALWIFGGALWRRLAWSFMLLLFLVPPPQFFLTAVSIPLRSMATEVSCAAASLLGVELTYDGTTIHLPAGTLEIEAACSGLRGAITLVLIAVFLGELRQAALRNRTAAMAAALGAALVLNVVRVLATILLVCAFGIGAATGTVHELLGLSIIVGGSILLTILPWNGPAPAEQTRGVE
jgi:exosortase